MKWSMVCAAICAAGVAGAEPSVTDVQASQDEASRLVSVSYTLSDGPAIVTVDFLTNGVSIGQENLQRLFGAVNREVETGARTLHWRPELDWPGHLLASGEMTASITVWPTNSPPDYLVVDLASGAREYYVSSNAVPDGITAIVYKTDKLPFRRIHAKGRAWLMGAPTNEVGSIRSDKPVDERQHRVILTHDYYMAVYPTTQRQYWIMRGSMPSVHSNRLCWASRPAENFTHEAVRERGASVTWPASGHAVGADSALAVCRSSLKGLMVDFPTEAQWEIACRAGTDTSHANGLNLNSPGRDDTVVAPLGRYNHNGGNKGDLFSDTTMQTSEVGTYAPNAWGLYDMHGNVWEMCLDRYDADYGLNGATVVTDPVGPPSGTTYVRKGGSYNGDAHVTRSARRSTVDGGQANGFRLCIEL